MIEFDDYSVDIPGLPEPEMTTCVGPNERRTMLLHCGDLAIIVKPIRRMNEVPETLLRKDHALRLFAEGLPQNTLPGQQVDIFPGYHNETFRGESSPPFVCDFPVTVRIAPWVDNVRTISQMKREDIFADVELCEALGDCFRFALTQLVRHRRILDLVPRFTRKQITRPRKFLAESLFAYNIMIGTDPPTGERIVFCDGDWYDNLDDVSKHPFLDGLIYRTLYLRSILVYTTAARVGRITRACRRWVLGPNPI